MFTEYIEWLRTEKNMTSKSAHDYASRLKRASLILNDRVVDSTALERLKINEDFLTLSKSVKSQIKRAVSLYLEYIGDIRE